MKGQNNRVDHLLNFVPILPCAQRGSRCFWIF